MKAQQFLLLFQNMFKIIEQEKDLFLQKNSNFLGKTKKRRRKQADTDNKDHSESDDESDEELCITKNYHGDKKRKEKEMKAIFSFFEEAKKKVDKSFTNLEKLQ